MRLHLLALSILLATAGGPLFANDQAAPVPASHTPQVTGERWLPLDIYSSVTVADDARIAALPFLSIGSLPDEWRELAGKPMPPNLQGRDFAVSGMAPPYVPTQIADAVRAPGLAKRLLADGKGLTGATSKATTFAYVIGPAASNPPEQFLPVALATNADGSEITLFLQSWVGFTVEQLRSMAPRRAVYAVSLGKLVGGVHKLHVQWDTMQRSALGGENYDLATRRVTSRTFEVDADASDQPGAEAIKASDFLAGPPAADAVNFIWTPPAVIARTLQMPLDSNGTPRAMYTQTGTFDLKAWLDKPNAPLTIIDKPQLTATVPGDGQPQYLLVLGPQINGGDSMTIREMRWNRDAGRLLVVADIWSKPQPDNARTGPAAYPLALLQFAVPVPTQAQVAAPTAEVVMEWHRYRYGNDGYVEELEK